MFKCLCSWFISVSYTHLDVYKRQSVNCVHLYLIQLFLSGDQLSCNSPADVLVVHYVFTLKNYLTIYSNCVCLFGSFCTLFELHLEHGSLSCYVTYSLYL